MEYLGVVLSSLFSLAVLFILTKAVGNKQVSELTVFDYIIGISIGSIAADLATGIEGRVRPLIAMIVYAAVSYVLSILTAKSIKIRRFIFGRSVVLMRNGKLFRRNMKKSHIDLSEFLMQCRSDGYFDITAVNTVILEPSGKMSIMPFPGRRPATPEDMKLVPAAEEIFANVIMDGVVLEENLRSTGHDVRWLDNELKSRKTKTAEVFLATLDRTGTLNIFLNTPEENKNDLFE